MTDRSSMDTPSVLIVDDEPHIRAVLARAFERAGFEVDVAYDGREALDAVRTNPPDAVVTDFQMPLLDGLGLAGQMRGIPKAADIPVVLLTARGHLVDESALADTNVRKVMPKPFGAREIIELVRGLIEQQDRSAA